MFQPNQTVPLPDNDFIVIRRVEEDKYNLERYNQELSQRWSSPIALEEDEQAPQLFLLGKELLVLFERELPNDKWQAIGRKFDIESGKLLSTKNLLETSEDPKHNPDDYTYFRYKLSDDNELILISTWRELIDASELSASPPLIHAGNSPAPSSQIARYTVAVFDKQLNNIQHRDISLANAVIEEKVHAEFDVTTDGDISVVYLYEQRDTYRAGFLRFPPNGEVDAFDDAIPAPSSGNNDAVPVQLFRVSQPDNSIIGIVRMEHDEATQSLVRFLWNPRTSDHVVSELLSITEETSKRLTSEETVEDYLISDIITKDGGTITILMEAHTSSSHAAGRAMQYQWVKDWWGPILILSLDHNGKLESTNKIERDEVWRSPDGNPFEGGYAMRRSNNKLAILTREYENDGVILREVDLDNNRVSNPQLVVELGGSGYYLRNFTIWLPNGNAVLWGKEGDLGDDLQMMRITP
jgi:hypothetical protein